jgi:hypothetical protein
MRHIYILLPIILSGCLNASIFTDYDRSNDFSSYKTFAWSPEPHPPHKNENFDTQIIENNIKNYASEELKKRGYVVDITNPDIILDFDILVEKKTQTVTSTASSYPSNYNGSYNNNRYNNSGYYGGSNVNSGYNNINSGYNNSNNGYNSGYNNNTMNNGYNNNMMPYQVGNTTSQVPYKEGTITIDVFDKKKNQFVWKGWAEEDLTDPESFSNDLQNDVHAIFKDYPVAVIKVKKK